MKIAIPTMSLGRPGLHPLDDKLHQAALHGFEGIELFIDDLDHLARTRFEGSPIRAAHHINRVCQSLNLTVICLQPFGFYEGLLDRTQTHHLLTEKLPLWFTLANILQTDLIQIPANFLSNDPDTNAPRTSPDLALIVSDLQTISDIGAAQSPPFRFVYEALCWSNHIDTWDAAYTVVEAVDRPNFGLCLDSFNLAGRVYADPAAPSGKTPTADADLAASLAFLRSGAVDLSKIFYIQLVDAERLAAPLDEAHEWHVAGQPPRMSWSRNARLFPFEEDRGGYLPIVEVARAFFDLGFDGWVSLELFSRTCADPNPITPRLHAKRGMDSWRKMVKALDVSVPVGEANVAPPVAVEEILVQHRL